MKNYVLRDEGLINTFKKSVIEIDNVEELVDIKIALELYLEEVKGFAETTNEAIKRIKSGNAYKFDSSIEKEKEDYYNQLKRIENLKRVLASLDDEIKVKQLEVKYKKI